MKVTFNICYNTNYEESVFLCGDALELGNNVETESIELSTKDNKSWEATIEMQLSKEKSKLIRYYYLIKKENIIVRKENNLSHIALLEKGCSYFIKDFWKDDLESSFLKSAPFQNCFLNRIPTNNISKINNNSIIQIVCPNVLANQELFISGNSNLLGNWNIDNAVKLKQISNDVWQFSFDKKDFLPKDEFKFLIKEQNEITWENGFNREFSTFLIDENSDINIIETPANFNLSVWKFAGCSVPVFSLRSQKSLGVGDFDDLFKLIDWLEKTGQKILQLLPVNDTTSTFSWLDSYPYNIVSTEALHPIYFGIKNYPLKNKKIENKILKTGEKLNNRTSLDYEKAYSLKNLYISKLFEEIDDDFFLTEEYLKFYDENKNWLFPYACFCYWRDQNGTSDFNKWKSYRTYVKEDQYKKMISDSHMQKFISKIYFTQYTLHKQLQEVKSYANSKGIALKGDIPIGVNPQSVETWSQPFLFNMKTQTGAPPDYFAEKGQNWGFPTYNWDYMEKDKYSWWIKRLKKMSKFFDAYRIDHILGFFRIWAIPDTAIEGLLGHFSPALGFSVEELNNLGLKSSIDLLSVPIVKGSDLESFFFSFTKNVISNFLEEIKVEHANNTSYFKLKESYNSQRKIKEYFDGIERTDENKFIEYALYRFANEVLFIKDFKIENKFHPKIQLQSTKRYEALNENERNIINSLYNNYYYENNNNFWKSEATKKLPSLINATNMLACGEDLGMIPNCVPTVMKELKILSLELERMSKTENAIFSDLTHLPYLSVCTTSTHDMTTLRMWWEEDRSKTNLYYSQILKYEGEAPIHINENTCQFIIKKNLEASSIITIIPIQDWFSISNEVRNKKYEDERINDPINPRHYWKYRMHLSLEELLSNRNFNKHIKNLIKGSGR